MTDQIRNAVFIDSGAFAALAIKTEENHRQATKTFRVLTAGQRRLLTTNFVVAETHALVLSRKGRDEAMHVLRSIDHGSTQVVRATEDDETRARAILAQYHDKSFSLVDAISFAVMERLGISDAFAFDRHFTQYGFHVMTASP